MQGNIMNDGGSGLAERVKMKDERFHKDTFDKTTAERRQKLIDVAVSEFAAKGYNATNINDIVKKAGISIGAMYSYFASKEDLFLAIVNKAYDLLEKALGDVAAENTELYGLLEGMLRASREYAEKYPELNQVYLDLSTQGLSQMAGRLSNKIESISSSFYIELLKKAKEEGVVAKDLDLPAAAFFIDNLIVMYQFSFSVDYYKERMKIFLGTDVMGVQELEQIIMGFIRKALE
jgi:AcrR family transcriptional regulator